MSEKIRNANTQCSNKTSNSNSEEMIGLKTNKNVDKIFYDETCNQVNDSAEGKNIYYLYFRIKSNRRKSKPTFIIFYVHRFNSFITLEQCLDDFRTNSITINCGLRKSQVP